jgi:hypothetical protein
MWAHYSGQHTGACLKFEVTREVDSPLLSARPVVYRDEPPSLPSKDAYVTSLLAGDDSDWDWDWWFDEFYYVKSTPWSYEREWRVVRHTLYQEIPQYTDVPFDARQLAAVLLGTATTEVDAASIIGGLTGELGHVEVYRGQLDHEDLRIVFDPVRSA